MKNKNHFFYSYCGNKRNEMKEIMGSIKDSNVEYIVEPFCGSCSFSYHMSLLHPNKYTYILNDNDKLLIELFNTVRDPIKLVEFETKINDICLTLNKDKYKELDINTLVGYYIKHKIYTMHPGIWITTYKYKYIKISDAPFYNFIVNEHIIFTCDDGLTTYLKYKNENAIIFVDPPYLNASNGLYTNPSGNI